MASKRPSRDRRSRRAQQHQRSVDEHDATSSGPIPDHPLIPAGEPIIVDTQAGLLDMVQHVRDCDVFAFDTEFIGEETYFPHICLVQIATSQTLAIIDPLAAGVDLQPIWELITDPHVEKLVHSGEQDIEPAVRLTGAESANVFDTQIAAGFLRRSYPVSLRDLVSEFTGVNLAKAFTFTAWNRRPISDAHVRYATDDVRYLAAVAAGLRAELDESGYAAWVQEECAHRYSRKALIASVESRLERLVSNRSLQRKQVSVLHALMQWRDALAQKRNSPPGSVLKDDVLVRIVKDMPKSIDTLATIKGMPSPLARDQGKLMLQQMQGAIEGAPDDLPRSRRSGLNPTERLQHDALWSLVNTFCQARGIDPGLVAKRKDVEAVITDSRRGGNAPSPLLTGWRYEFIGSMLEDFLAGRRAATFQWADGQLHVDADQAE